jgi:hypothetical protein
MKSKVDRENYRSQRGDCSWRCLISLASPLWWVENPSIASVSPIILVLTTYNHYFQLQIATALGWHPIIGIEAMIEQGLAQQRMWARGDASVEVGCDEGILGDKVENDAREWVGGMKE